MKKIFFAAGSLVLFLSLVFAGYTYGPTVYDTTSNFAAALLTKDTLIVYDGEPGSAPLLTGSRSCLFYAEEVNEGRNSTKSLKFTADMYHAPGYSVNCGGQERLDFSPYSFLEFHIKSNSKKTEPQHFNIVSYYGSSATVDMMKYIEGGVIDTTWRKVSIPLSALKTATYNVNTVDTLYFGNGSAGRIFYVDDIILRKSSGRTLSTGQGRPAPGVATEGKVIATVPNPDADTSVPSEEAAEAPEPVENTEQEEEEIPAEDLEDEETVAELIKNYLEHLFENNEEKEMEQEPVLVTAGASTMSTYDFDEVDLANNVGHWLYAENSTHVSLNFTEKFDTAKVKNNSNYSIKSSDDPAYSAPRQPSVKGYRWRTAYAPTIRKTDLKVIYRVFLELPSELKNGKTYTVTASNIGLPSKSFTFTFNDADLNRNIKVNQVGYLPNAQKIGYVGQYAGTGGPLPFSINEFHVRDASGRSVYKGTPVFRNIDTNNTGENVYELNFSEVTASGVYTLYVPGVGVSYPFRIGNDVYNEVLANALSGAYHQRASTALTKEFTRFTHGPAHMADAYVMNHNPIPEWFRGRFDSQGDTRKKDSNGKRAYYGTSLSGQFIDASKGHYDAGDYGKYTVNGALFAGNLLTGFNAFPAQLMKDDLGVPESGNGIPDVLEEAKWELDWLENMQDPNDGGVFCIVKPDGAVEYYENRAMDAASPSKRLLYPKDTTCTAHYAAVLAKAGANELYKKHYPDAAARYIEKAKKSWTFLEKNPGYLGWHHYGVKDEFDTDKSMDERVWAAMELYNATGEKTYLDFVLAKHKPEYERWGWNTLFEASGQANYACAFTKRSGMDSMKQRCVNEIIKAADSHVKDSQNRAYRLSMSDAPLNYRDYTYFFPQERIIQLLVAHSLKSNNAYVQTALYNWDYILGSNPTGYSYITGIGSKRFREIVHTQSMYDGIKPPVPGIPVGMGNNFGYLEVYGSKLAQMFPVNNGGSPDPKVSYPLLAQVYDGWNIGVEFTVPEIAENIISAAYFGTLNDSKNKAPSRVDIVADKTTGSVPLTVSFKGSGVDGDGKIVRYHWDFDDESYSIQQNPVHTFTEPYKVYNVVLTVTDNDGLQKYKELQIRTTPQVFAFNAQPHTSNTGTFALFNFDSSFADSSGKGYVFKNNGAELSDQNILWMQNPSGKAVAFDSVTDSIEVELPRKTVFGSAQDTLIAEAKIYVDTFLSYNVADSKIFVLMQNDDKLIGLFDAKYVDGTHARTMNGYNSQKKLLTSEQVAALMKQGKMQTKTWYNLKLVVSAGKAEIWVNNDKVGETDVSPQFAGSDSPIKLVIGGFKGYVDEVRVSGR